jgi:hypothetical protein
MKNSRLLRRLKRLAKDVILTLSLAERRNAKKYEEIERIILAINDENNVQIFPMFGTLLFLRRDGFIRTADDFDFAVAAESILDKSALVEQFEHYGFVLCSLSTVKTQEELVELSFRYEGVKVDIFFLGETDEGIVHACPNFRKEEPTLDRSIKGAVKAQYDSYFQVVYPHAPLVRDSEFKLPYPLNFERIFEIHYGMDWKVPKRKNFIDFSGYMFVSEAAYTIEGAPLVVKKCLSSLL